MTHRIVKDSFWTDPYIEDLNAKEKLFFLYLITNPLCNIAGFYEIRIKRMVFETALEEKEIKKIIQKFIDDKKIYMMEDYILVKNFAKNQSVNPSVIKGIERVLKTIPKRIWMQLNKSYPDSIEALSYFTKLNLTLPKGIISKDIIEKQEDFSKTKKCINDKNTNKGNIEINKMQKLIKNEVEKRDLIYASSWQERARINNIINGKEINNVSKLYNKNIFEFVVYVFKIAQESEFWKNKIDSGVFFYKNYAKIINDHKEKLLKNQGSMDFDFSLNNFGLSQKEIDKVKDICARRKKNKEPINEGIFKVIVEKVKNGEV